MRFEKKFLVHEGIRGDLKNLLNINSYYKIYPNRQVTSIYYDSNEFEMFHDSDDGLENRKKIRLRFYNQESENMRLEKKIKSAEIGFKEYTDFSKIDPDFLSLKLFDSEYQKEIKIPKSIESIFFPSLLVKYFRDYYGNKDNTVRITFDYNLFFSNIYNPKCSIIKPFFIPGNFSVIEIKYEHDLMDCPEIIEKIANNFNINISRCSKYAEGIRLCF